MRTAVALLLLLTGGGPALAGEAEIRGLLTNKGTYVDAVSLASTRYTGWIPVSQEREVVLEIDWNDVDGNVSEIEMVCWSARASSGANGTGYEIVVATATLATGETNYEQHKWSWAFTDGDTEWEWVVTSPRALFINCAFSAGTGTSQSGDQLTVYARGGTP